MVARSPQVTWSGLLAAALFGIMLGLMAVLSVDMLFFSGRFLVDTVRDYAKTQEAGECSPSYYARTPH